MFDLSILLAEMRNSYGGIYERGSREYTLDDFHSLQLDKLDRYICLKKSDVIIPAEGDDVSSSEDDSDEDDSDGEDSDESAVEEEDSFHDIQVVEETEGNITEVTEEGMVETIADKILQEQVGPKLDLNSNL